MKTSARVLIVEDTPDLATEIADLLEMQCYDVSVAQHGRLALEILNVNPADLVITDLVMPEIDGLQLIGRMRSDERLKDVPVVLLTAKGESDIEKELNGFGATTLLRKPCRAEVLISTVANLLRQHTSH